MQDTLCARHCGQQSRCGLFQSQPYDSEYRRAVETIAALNGPVSDVEKMFTNLDLGRGVFRALSEDQRNKLKGAIQRCIRECFKRVCDERLEAPLYRAFANVIKSGDHIITFNYDVALENELIAAQKFLVKDGYGPSFHADWDEADSEITVLKLHGSINWIALLFGGSQGFGAFTNSMGLRPFVDNSDSVLPAYPARVLDRTFRGGGVAGGATSLVLPTYEKRYSVQTSVGDEWEAFYDGLWIQAADFRTCRPHCHYWL